MNKVVPISTYKNVDTHKVLQGAMDKDLELCVVVGYNKDRELYVGSTTGDTAEIFRTLQTAFRELSGQ